MNVVDGSEVIYRPSPKQAMFHGLDHDEALFAGSAGPGKTAALIADPLEQVMVEHERCAKANDHQFPLDWGRSVGWALHLRRTSKDLIQTIQRAHRLYSVADPNLVWNERHQMFTFSSGYKMQFGHCKNPSDWAGFLSQEYTHIGYDELVQFQKEQYSQINLRKRTTDPVLKHMMKIRACSNPCIVAESSSSSDSFTVDDPTWVRRYFVEPAPMGGKTLTRTIRVDGLTKKSTRIFLRATIDDNPDPEFVAQYKLTLAGAPAHMRQAYLYGDWWITINSFFGESWNPNLHVCAPFKVPSEWKVFRSLDWGKRVPGCVHWWALSGDDELYCIKELTFKGKDDIEVAKMILQVEKDLDLNLIDRNGKSRITGPADTQLWEERGQSSKNMAAVMAEAGVRWIKADKTSRQANAGRVSKRLDAHQDGTLRPGLIFFRNCKMVIQNIPAMQTDPKNHEQPFDGENDHWADSCFYACAYASHGAGCIAERTKEKDPWEEEDAKKPKANPLWGNTWGSA